MSFAVVSLFLPQRQKRQVGLNLGLPHGLWRQKSCLKGKLLDGTRAMKLRSPEVCSKVAYTIN
jgi:hypothetical protein